MRTTIDLPDDLFREAKTYAVHQGTTLKEVITQCVQLGLRGQPLGQVTAPARRGPPPVAIRRESGLARTRARSNRELHALLEEEEIRAAGGGTQSCHERP